MKQAQSASSLYLGTITGTSVDGLDLALINTGDTSSSITILASSTDPFPEQLRLDLLKAGQPGDDDLDRLGQLDVALGRFIGESTNRFLASHNLTAHDIAAIGSHGQTVRHRPDGHNPFTWQIGDPNQIVELTGITTVADFRRRDMAAGGQGAPLVPSFHETLFSTTEESRVIVNIGGISNLTRLDRNKSVPLTGFDSGAGNALLDAWCQSNLDQAYDSNGSWASSGTVLDDLLIAMQHDPYLNKPPPKSTGREYFNLAWLNQYLNASTHKPEDVQRTLLEYTACTITEAVSEWAHPCDKLIICGGGRLNEFLMTRLQELASCPVAASEDYGIDGDAIEAAAFAWLAACCLNGKAGNADAVTGASGLRILGGIYQA